MHFEAAGPVNQTIFHMQNIRW